MGDSAIWAGVVGAAVGAGFGFASAERIPVWAWDSRRERVEQPEHVGHR
jgi:hypothetical protein